MHVFMKWLISQFNEENGRPKYLGWQVSVTSTLIDTGAYLMVMRRSSKETLIYNTSESMMRLL